MMQTAALLASGKPGADLPDPNFVERLHRDLRTAATASPRDISRRRFLATTGSSAAAAAVGGLALGNLLGHAAGSDTTQETLQPDRGDWTHVTDLSSLQQRRPVRFSLGSVEGYVVRDGDGVQAVSAACTHLGCIVQSSGEKLWCPCKGATFALDGTIVNGNYNAPRPLPVIQARVEGNSVQVFVPYV